MMRHTAVIASALAFAWPVAGHAQSAVLLRLAPDAGAEMRYQISVRMEMGMQGAPAGSPGGMSMTRDMFVTQRVVAAEGDVRDYLLVTDSMRTQGAFGAAQPNMDGVEQMMQMDTRGRVLSMEVNDPNAPPDVRAAVADIREGMRGLGWELPERAVAIGDTWDTTQEFAMPGQAPGMGGGMTMRSTYQLERVGTEGGARTAVIAVTGTMEMGGDQGAAASGLDVSGDMEGEIVLDLSAGRLIRQTSNLAMHVQMAQQPMAMTMTLVFENTLLEGSGN